MSLAQQILQQNKMDYAQLPKIELHLHLDCSLSYKVAQQLKPSLSLREYKQSFIAPPKCTDLADYIKRAVKGFELMQTKANLRLVTLDLFEQLKADNVLYAEIRFAPLQHTLQGLSAHEIVETVNAATNEGIKYYGLEAGLILCTLRHYSEAQSLQTVRLVEDFKGTTVVGFDIAADEAGFPIDNHITAFRFAKAKNIPCTAHAGEAKGAESVWETLHNFHPLRIGHGVRSAEDKALLQLVKAKGIHLEVCLTSNIQTNVFKTIADHTVNELYKAGVSISISTDARTISDTTLVKEYALLENVFHWDKAHFRHCNLEAINHSFAPKTTKEKISEQIKMAYG